LEAVAREQFALARAEYDAQVAVAELKAKDSKEKAKNKLAKEPNADVTDLMRHAVIAAPVRRRYITINATTEALGEVLKENPNGVVNVRDEMMALLHKLDEEGQSEARGFHLQAWSGVTDYNFDRIGRGLDNYIPAVCVSMIGGTQPAKISQYIAQIRRGNRGNDGLIQRFGLMVWPDITPEWVNVDRYPKAMARDMATAVFERLDALDASAIGARQDRIGDKDIGLPYLRLAPAAQELFLEWRTDLERRLRSGEMDPMMEGHLAKYRKLVPSLALIIHLADSDATAAVGDVSVDAVQRALRWAAYLETHAIRVYGSGDAALVVAANAIIAKVKSGHLKGDGFSSRDVWRPQWSLLRDRDMAHAALKMLVDYDWLSAAQVETGGRKATVYSVNPKVHS
jgi:putative DNA primase/helicase